ncbi:MAG: hypothetical protein IKW59_08425 [Clostridia bacterium]|nr:hypothetical protein [Clostridia bacterium]
MFELKDHFTGHDENLQPYSFELEKHTYVENLHAAVHDKHFHMKSVGNRYVLNTPKFKTGSFRTEFLITFLKEYDPCFTVFFQYDKKTRRGLGLRFTFALSGTLAVALIKQEEHRSAALSEKVLNDFNLDETKFLPLNIDIDENEISCAIGTKNISFDCDCAPGQIAIERKNFIGELIFKDIYFKSDDNLKTRSILKPVTAEIPLTNGGDIPYRVTWQIDEIENEYFLNIVLDGGTSTREYNQADRPLQFNVEIDHMTTPYVGLFSNGTEECFNIANGDLCFVDSNVYRDFQRDFFKNTPLPIIKCFKINPKLIKDGRLSADSELIFGYEHLLCKGYANQQGASQFRYNTDGTATYSGDALNGQDIFEVFSPFDKYAMSLIPEDCYKKDEVIEHIKYNHYFECSEDIDFTLEMRTMKESKFVDIKAEIENVYETEPLATSEIALSTETTEKNYTKIKASAKFNPLDTGVYKIVFKVFYGGKLYKQIKHVFEVFNKDTDDIPALKSGLPFVFSMANEIKWLKRNAFDLWNPKHSCDSVHYITCVTDTPTEAETRKTWELTKSFKRKWYVWLAPRTCRDYDDYEKHKETLKHADYIFYTKSKKGYSKRCQITQFPLRSDHWTFITTASTFHQELLKEFLSKNPEAAKVVNMDFENETFSTDHYERLMGNYRVEWIDYINNRVLEILDEQNKELAGFNPDAKRSMYGPVSVYITPTVSYRSLPDYGLPNDERLAQKVFTGFTTYEDYPIACAYPTYRGPFTLTSILLHCPGIKMYPEQYREDKGGNIDGAVKFAHAPMAVYSMEPRQYSTHSFEYVFNTAYRLSDGYHYWDTYGFHRRDHGPAMLEELAKDWRYVIENKPQKPLRSMAFIAEYDESDTLFDIAVNDEGTKLYAFSNASELASGFIHECSREAGIPNGFSTKFDVLSSISADECDLIVVPTLKNADASVIKELRRLYNEGVNLIGLSDVTGLEDIFGVRPFMQKHEVNTLSYKGENENIYGTYATFNYVPDGAEILAYTDGDMPAILAADRTALINTHILSLGCENKNQRDNRPNSYCIVGKLIKKVLSDVVKNLSSPLAEGVNVGITLFEAEAGHTELMAINYVPQDNRTYGIKEAVIRFNMDNLTDVKCDRELFVCKENGIVKEIRFDIKPFESVFITLDTN